MEHEGLRCQRVAAAERGSDVAPVATTDRRRDGAPEERGGGKADAPRFAVGRSSDRRAADKHHASPAGDCNCGGGIPPHPFPPPLTTPIHSHATAASNVVTPLTPPPQMAMTPTQPPPRSPSRTLPLPGRHHDQPRQCWHRWCVDAFGWTGELSGGRRRVQALSQRPYECFSSHPSMQRYCGTCPLHVGLS